MRAASETLTPPSPLVVATAEAKSADRPAAIFLGTGIASRRTLGTGDLPLDALAMVMAAEHERRARGAEKIVHLIADAHALVNEFATPPAVASVAARLEAQLTGATAALGLLRYQVVRATDLDDDLHRQLHYDALTRCADPYAARQGADIEWARLRHGATVKVGWTMTPRLDAAPTGRDERYFDDAYRLLFGDHVTAVYVGPGRRLDPERPGTIPYLVEPGECGRLTVRSESADVAIACSSRSMRRHLRPLVAALADALGLQRLTDVEQGVGAVLAELARRRAAVLC